MLLSPLIRVCLVSWPRGVSGHLPSFSVILCGICPRSDTPRCSDSRPNMLPIPATSRGLLRRALCRPPGPGAARALCSVAVPASARKYRSLAPLNAKKARGLDILNDPLWNKGTAFSVPERDRLGLKGLLPQVVKTIEEQRDGFLLKMREQRDPVDQNLLLRGLHDRNETLFHRVLTDCIDEVAPLVYTPTVGQACQRFSAQYVRQRGLTLTPEDRGCMGIVMENWAAPACQVCTPTLT